MTGRGVDRRSGSWSSPRPGPRTPGRRHGCTPAGAGRPSRCSADVTTTASAPSDSRQLSKMQSGSEIQRESMYSSRVSGRSCITALGFRLACTRAAERDVREVVPGRAELVHVAPGQHRDLVDGAQHPCCAVPVGDAWDAAGCFRHSEPGLDPWPRSPPLLACGTARPPRRGTGPTPPPSPRGRPHRNRRRPRSPPGRRTRSHRSRGSAPGRRPTWSRSCTTRARRPRRARSSRRRARRARPEPRVRFRTRAAAWRSSSGRCPRSRFDLAALRLPRLADVWRPHTMECHVVTCTRSQI